MAVYPHLMVTVAMVSAAWSGGSLRASGSRTKKESVASAKAEVPDQHDGANEQGAKGALATEVGLGATLVTGAESHE